MRKKTVNAYSHVIVLHVKIDFPNRDFSFFAVIVS